MSLPRFMIHKHAARRLHYDFRLEADGVFKSWAIPKGPSLNPRDRRLAIAVEDHSLAYGSFEGVLAEGTYGAGAVLVWDVGTYRNLSQAAGQLLSMEQALETGSVTLWLEGRKLRGGYSLRRTPALGAHAWLLIKLTDEAADPDRDLLQTEPRSVVSGRTIEDIADERSG